MKKSENWLLSKPYVLNVLYFGSLGWILYSLYKHYSDLEIGFFEDLVVWKGKDDIYFLIRS